MVKGKCWSHSVFFVRVYLTVNHRGSKCLQGKHQINVPDLLIQNRPLPFYAYRLPKLYLKLSSHRV